jgi:glutamine cyclotransferase
MKAHAALLLLLGLCWSTWSGADGIPQLEYRVIGELPHSRNDFTQGLEIRDGTLYQGTGLVGQSRLQAFDLETGALVRERELPPPFFGEGITVLGDLVVQLTWQSRWGFVYRRQDFALLGKFPLVGQGWGLTNDGKQLIYSDGSNLLRYIDPQRWAVSRTLRVRRGDRPVHRLNELEWTPNGLWANVWQSDVLVRIDLDTGEVTGELDLKSLVKRDQRRHREDVLNGIAYNAGDGSLWVTGKNWPRLYQLEIIEPTSPETP